MSRLEITFGGKEYFNEGGGWFEKASRLRVSESLGHLLDEETGHQEDPVRLRRQATEARQGKDYAKAETLVRRALRIQPGHQESQALLCSVLRRSGQPQRALDETEDLPYPPLLTSRAAALCDLGQWKEAAGLVQRTRQLSQQLPWSEAAITKVIERIRAARPDLAWMLDQQ